MISIVHLYVRTSHIYMYMHINYCICVRVAHMCMLITSSSCSSLMLAALDSGAELMLTIWQAPLPSILLHTYHSPLSLPPRLKTSTIPLLLHLPHEELRMATHHQYRYASTTHQVRQYSHVHACITASVYTGVHVLYFLHAQVFIFWSNPVFIRDQCLFPITCNCEYSNEHDEHAVAVLKDGEIVGHLPNLVYTMSLFSCRIRNFASYKLQNLYFWAHHSRILHEPTSNSLAAASFDVLSATSMALLQCTLFVMLVWLLPRGLFTVAYVQCTSIPKLACLESHSCQTMYMCKWSVSGSCQHHVGFWGWGSLITCH